MAHPVAFFMFTNVLYIKQEKQFPTLFHSHFVHGTANLAKHTQVIVFQKNTHINNILCNDLFFKGLQVAKKGLM